MQFRKLLALFLAVSVLTYAQGNTFTKVRYNGGSVSTTVKPDDWDNKLTVSSEAISFTLKDGQTISILPKQVTALSYGQEAHRRVGTAVALAFISLGVGALFALHKTKLHFIGIDYMDKDGKKQGLLFQGDKSNFRAIIVALQGVTGIPVSVSEKERSEIPAGIAVQAVKEPEPAPQTAATPAAPAPPAVSTTTAQGTAAQDAPESLAVTSNPDAGEIYVDDSLIGNAPTTLKLTPGKHKIRVSLPGYKDWIRDVTAQSGSEAHIMATLEKAN
jgi:hypothetical protein